MKKYLINILALVLGVVMCNGVFAAGGINTGKGAVPFGSNTRYEYGLMPTNLPSGTYGGATKAAEAYEAWKGAYVTSCGSNQYRVKFDDGNSTVSEGIAYGMLLSVYADDKNLFDGLWAYYQANVNGNGVMNWKISGCSGVSGSNGATDAELDVAMALVIASEQWPSGNYAATAKSFIKTIKNTEMHSNGQTLNGDAWGNQNSCRNPSYFAPAYYKEFAKVDTDNASFWGTTAINASNSVLSENRDSTSGLVSNWCDDNGTANACGNTGDGAYGYGSDACRNPWRMAVDYLWHGSGASSAATDINGKLAKFVKGYENQLKGPFGNRGVSNPGSGSYVNGAFSTFALPPMTQSDQSSVNKCYSAVAGLQNVDVYFNSTIRCITLFVMTGNFWAPGASGFVFPPSVSSAETDANGNIVLNMSTEMAGTSASASNFTVYYNGTAQSGVISSVSISGKKITLNVSTAAKPGQSIELSYNGTGNIKSVDNAAMEAFTKIEVVSMVAGNETILDDCEDGNEFNNVGGIWFTFNDKPDHQSAATPGTVSTITPLSSKGNPSQMTAGGCSESPAYAMHATYKLGTPYKPQGNNVTWTNPAYVGIGTWVDDDETNSMDWSKGTGVTFYYKGPKCSFQVIISEVTDYCFHRIEVPATSNWTKVTVRWNELAQPTWGTAVSFSAKHVQKLQWQFETGTTGDPGATGDIWIDEVHILGMPPVELTSLAISPMSDTDLAKDDLSANIDPLKIPIASGAKKDTLYLETTPTPGDATYPVVFWSSSDEDVVTVDYKGRVIGVGYGEATITARSKMHQNISATYDVKVPAPAVKPTGITFAKNAYEVTVGETTTIIPTFSPDGVTETGLTWTSSDQTKATVSSSGVVTGIAEGTATITATSTAEGCSNVKKSVTVTVKPVAVTAVTVDKTAVEIEVGASAEVVATVAPSVVSQAVTATSSNTDVATVAVSGSTITVSSVAKGTATITVASVADPTITTTFSVTVTGVSVTGVTVTGEQEVVKGQTTALSAAVAPSTVAQTVTWSSSDETVATVNTAGVVTGVAVGTATIRATSTEDDTKYADYEVTVTPLKVASITVTPATLALKVGEESTALVVTVSPNDADDKTYTWSSSNESVATIDAATGIVTAVAKGSATITATAKDGSGKKGECAVTVTDVMPTSIAMDKTLNFTVGDAAKTLTATVLPENATDKTITWSSSDQTVATVADGVVTPVGEGSCTITATSVADANVKAECTVTVSSGVVAVTGVTLDATATVAIGQTVTLAATIEPAGATNTNVSWTSSNTAVATVANGVVKGLSAGKSTITVTTEDGSFTATCVVTVNDVLITSLSIDPEKEELFLNMESTPVALSVSYEPENATNTAVTWSSSDESVVTVANGVVTPKGVGTATITVSYDKDNTIKATCKVTVKAISVESVALNKETAEISVGGTVALTPTVTPANATNKAVTWKSSDETVATVADGVVTGIAAGEATITVTTVDGSKTATCAVTVKANTIAVTGVTLNPSGTKTVALNESLTFVATVTPTTATNKNISWSSSDESVATVADGVVTLKKVGTTTITVKTEDGDIEATCVLTVTDIPVANIIIDNALSLKVGETGNLTATIMPDGASATLVWESDKPAIATVDATGKVTAVAAGTANITAKTSDGTVVSDNCVVTVSNIPVTAVAIDATTAVIRINGTKTLSATVTPANATNQKVNWTSSKSDIATVDATGKVTAVAVGTATITAASDEDAYTKSTCAVEVVDASALETELATAKASHSSAVEGTEIGNYKAGSKATFQTAIAAAQTVFDNANATQTELDAALSALKDAEKTFAKAIIANETLIFNAELKQENMTQMATYWFSFNDGEASDDPSKCGSSVVDPLSTIENPFSMSTPGYNGTGKAAMMKYTLEGKAALGYNPFVGMGMQFTEPAGGAFDMTGSTGVSFWIKSNNKVYFEVEMTTITDAADYYIYLPAAPEWTLVELTWDQLEQYSWTSKPQVWDLTKLSKMQWKVQEDDGTTGQVWVDEVKILGVALDLPEIVDYEELYSAIGEAKEFTENAVVGTDDGNYPQSAVTALNTAITKAEAVVNKAKTQKQADDAVTALKAAINTFKDAVVSVDRSVLETYIAQAEDLYDNSQEGYQEGMYIQGSRNILLAAIEAAKDVDGKESVSKAEVDEAATALKTAIETFKNSKFDPNSINRTALKSAIAEANTLLAKSVEGSGDGQYPVGAKDALSSAVTAAQTVDNTTSSTQEDVDAATSTLRAAITAFENQKISVNKTALTTEISTATALYKSSTEGPYKGNYPEGSKATLQAAIDAATAVKNNTSASQTDVDAAVAALKQAEATFKSLQIKVDKSQLIYQLSLAEAALAKADGNTGDGSGQYPATAVSIFTNAINYGKEINASTSVDQSTIDGEVVALKSAITEFENSKNPVVEVIDLAQLALLISEADSLLDNTRNPSYNFLAYIELNVRKSNAKTEYEKETHIQANVDKQAKLLAEAIAAFKEAFKDAPITGVEDAELVAMAVYPNPCQNEITFSAGKEIQSVAIVSLTGATQFVAEVADATATLDVSGIKAGIYFAKVQFADGSVETKRFVKR